MRMRGPVERVGARALRERRRVGCVRRNDGRGVPALSRKSTLLLSAHGAWPGKRSELSTCHHERPGTVVEVFLCHSCTGGLFSSWLWARIFDGFSRFARLGFSTQLFQPNGGRLGGRTPVLTPVRSPAERSNQKREATADGAHRSCVDARGGRGATSVRQDGVGHRHAG